MYTAHSFHFNMDAVANHNPTEHVCVYARVRPCSSLDSVSCVRVDAAQDTVHCNLAGLGSPISTLPSAGGLPSGVTPMSPTGLNVHVAAAAAEAAASVGSYGRRPPPSSSSSRHRPQPEQTFTFDQVVEDLHAVETTAFFTTTAQICAEAYLLEGRDVTVLCMGEQGSGKSSTAFGDGEEPGLCARILLSLFAAMQRSAAPGVASSLPCGEATVTAAAAAATATTRHEVTLSCLLLQGERLVDLLAVTKTAELASRPTSPSSPSTLAPSQAAAAAAHVSVPAVTMDVHGAVVMRGVSQLTCATAEEAIGSIHRCRRAQATLNPAFGHVVVLLDVVSQEVDTVPGGGEEVAAMRQARLLFVDLASIHTSAFSTRPSSRAVVSAPSRAEENAIRPSLDVLRAVIIGLVDAAAHERRPDAARSRFYASEMAYTAATAHSSPSPSSASALSLSSSSSSSSALPYRHCKLTMLLKGHLGGTCHTVVIAHARSELEHRSESLSTLRLARQLQCVPAQLSAAHRTVDLAVQVRQLQRQVAALQSDLRLQVELNRRNAVLAAEMLRSAAAEEEEEEKKKQKGSGAGRAGTATGGRSDARRGAGAALSSGSSCASSAAKRKFRESRGGRAHASSATPQRGQARPPPSLSLAWPMPPSSAPLQAAVVDFLAGRLPVLPVTSIEEMNTCFELLRRHVAERDVRLGAATSDLRAAQAAAVAAAFWSTTSGGVGAGGASRRSSNRSSGRSSSTGRSSLCGQERRRASSLRRGDGPLTADGTRESRTSVGHNWGAEFRASWLPSSSSFPFAAPAAEEAFGTDVSSPGRLCQTSLLEEASPTRLTAESGVGYGSAPARSAGSPAREATPAASASLVEEQTVTQSEAAATVAAGLAAHATFAPQQVSPLPAAASQRRHTLPFLAAVDNPRSQQKLDEGVCTSSLPPESATVTAAHFLSSPSPSPFSLSSTAATPSKADASPQPQRRSPESLAFDRYVTETAEGRQLADMTRQAEASVAGLQKLCTAAEASSGAATTTTAAAPTAAVKAAYAAAVELLTHRRQTLLQSFEAWHNPQPCSRAVTAIDSPSRSVTSGTTLLGATPHRKTTAGLPPSFLRLYTGSGVAAAGGQIPRLRMRPSSSTTPRSTPREGSATSSPVPALVAASIYRS